MKSSFFLLLAGCFLGIVAAKTTQTDTNKQVHDSKIVLHQIFHPGAVNCKAEISSLRKEIEMLRKDLTHLLTKNETKGKGAICELVNLLWCFIIIFTHSTGYSYHLYIMPSVSVALLGE